MMFIIATVLLTVLQQTPPPPAQSAPPPCTVSEDATYGLTIENPVQIGGGAMYVAARERRYLDALRGPAGQAIRYNRTGSMTQGKNSSTIIDHYNITWDGLDKPISLYLDAYHYWEQRAPKGLTCVQAFQLQPILDNFQALESLMSTAVDEGASREFTPIPLDGDGTTTHGVVWDGFRTLAAASHAAAAAGKKMTARPGDAGTVVVAYPLTCEGRTVTPVGVELVPPQGAVLSPNGGVVKDASGIARRVPGATIPPGSVAAPFQLQQLPPTVRVRVTYSEAACPQGTTVVLLPLKFTQAKPIDFAEPSLPEGANPSEKQLLVQVLIDLDGRLQRATYLGGPTGLQQAALEAVKTWRAEPARINGAPVPWPTLVGVRFK